MPSSRQVALLCFFAVVATLLIATGGPWSSCSALAPVTHSHLDKPDRKKFCGSDTDCVIVKEHGAGGVLRIDDLDLMIDTPDTLRKKLPSWFGPRPCKFVYNHNMLPENRPLAHSGVEIMNSIIIYEANSHQAAELDGTAEDMGLPTDL